MPDDKDKKLSCPKQEFECYAIHLSRRCHERCIFAAKYHKGSIGSSGIYCGMWWIFHSRVSEHSVLIERYGIDRDDYELIKR